MFVCIYSQTDVCITQKHTLCQLVIRVPEACITKQVHLSLAVCGLAGFIEPILDNQHHEAGSVCSVFLSSYEHIHAKEEGLLITSNIIKTMNEVLHMI